MSIFSSCDDQRAADDDDIPSMPCFEASNVEDRPFAPSAEDYPLGCEVELRDVEFAKLAQEPLHWEPFMEEVFFVSRRRVKVCRHSGDYTFVICTDIEGFTYVGCTLYRACLSEPKVKTTKYYTNIATQQDTHHTLQLGPNKSDGTGEENLSPLGLPKKQARCDGAVAEEKAADDMAGEAARENSLQKEEGCVHPQIATRTLANIVAPSSTSLSPHPPRKRIGTESFRVNNPLLTSAQQSKGINQCGDPCSFGHVERVDSSREAGGGKPSSPSEKFPTISSYLSRARRRSKFALAMKKGTLEIERKDYEKALRYYNAALKDAPEEEARVLSSRSVAYLLLQQTENALNDAKRVIELQPDSYLGYVRAGNILRGTKLFDEAQSFYKEGLRRDPENVTIRKLLMGNSVAMLYDARTKRYPKFKIAYDEVNVRVVGVARQDSRAGDGIITETTSLIFPLMATTTTPKGVGTHSNCCWQCSRVLVRAEEMCRSVAGLTPELFRSLYNEPEPVLCNSGCGASYCSDECRSKAWAESHWVECGARGRWRDGVSAVHAYLDDYIERNARNQGGQHLDTRIPHVEPSCPAEDNSVIIVATSVRIAVRMLCRMVSSVWSLPEAVHMYDWMRVSPCVEACESSVKELLHECYNRLSRSYATEEKERLTYAVFERCYERVKSNALVLCVSSWNKILIRAESHMALVEEKEEYGLGSSARQLGDTCRADHFAMQTHPSSIQRATVTQRSCLRNILNAPTYGVKGSYTYCLAVFELLSATLPVNTNSQRGAHPTTVTGPHPLLVPSSYGGTAEGGTQRPCGPVTLPASPEEGHNIKVQRMVEPYGCVHVVATRSLAKGEVLRADWPLYHFDVYQWRNVECGSVGSKVPKI